MDAERERVGETAVEANNDVSEEEREEEREGNRHPRHVRSWTYIKYSQDFLRTITTAGAFEAIDWPADLLSVR